MNALPLRCIPAACIFKNITANTCRLFEHCYNVFCSDSSVLSRSMSFFPSLSKIIRGDTRVRTRDLSDCNRMLYHWAISPLPAAYRFNNITANTLRLFEHCYNVFCSESSVLSRSMSFFSSLSKAIQGDNRVRTRDLSDCSRVLYHWAISPLHTDSIPSLQTRAGCFSTVTMFFCSESSVLSRSMSFFSSLSKIIRGDTRIQTRDLSDCSRMVYHWAISPLHTDSIPSLQTREGCLSTVTMFFVPSQVYSRDRCHFSLVFQKLYKETPGFKQGTSWTAAECSTTELYPRCIQTQNITANTLRLFEHCYNVFYSESSVLSRSMSFFSSLLKIIQGSARVRTRDLSDCSRMLYHWVISPLHTDSIPSLQTRAGCLSTVTMCFVPSQVFSRNRCHFSLVFQKFYKGTPGFEPGTSRTAAECSTTELYPRCIQIQYHHCKHVKVVWALLQCFLFRVKCTLGIDVIFL